MTVTKKIAAVLTALILAGSAASATSFNIALSTGYSDSICVGLSSDVVQDISDTLTIDSTVTHLPNHEYEATLKANHQILSWMGWGAGFLLFTDESAMLPAVTASISFTLAGKQIIGFSGGFGLNEKNLKKPYLYRVSHTAHYITRESIIDFGIQWQQLQPDAFSRQDVTSTLKIYAVSPDNPKFKLCLGMNGSFRMDNRSDMPFNLTVGLLTGVDYGTEKQGFSISYAITPVDSDKWLNPKKPLSWMVSTGFRFLY